MSNAARMIPALRKGGPYIGPRGGKWADAQHKVPWTGPMRPRARAHHGALHGDDIRALEAHISERMGDNPPPGKKFEIPLEFGATGVHILEVKAVPEPMQGREVGGEASRSQSNPKQGHVVVEVRSGRKLQRSTLRGVLAHELAHASDPDLNGGGISTRNLHAEDHAEHPAEKKAYRAEASMALEEPEVIAHGRYLMEHGTPWGKKPLSKAEAADSMLNMVPTKRGVTQAGLLPEMHAYAMKLLGSDSATIAKASPRMMAPAPDGTGYRGVLNFHGIPVGVEVPTGGINPHSGRKVKVCYGDIPGTVGVDGDPVDVILGPHLDSQRVFVLQDADSDDSDSPDEPKQYGEDKVALGFETEEQARAGWADYYQGDNRAIVGVLLTTVSAIREHLLEQPENRGMPFQVAGDDLQAMTVNKALLKGGPYIGPRGGKWADAAHKIPWKEQSSTAKQVKPDNPEPEESDDYRMQHQPAKGAAGHLLGTTDDMPKDILQKPEWYTGYPEEAKEFMPKIRAGAGNPNAKITIYRAMPKAYGKTIESGNWITPSKTYAESHAEGEKDWHVVEFEVSLKDINWAGDDLMEWGYWGDNKLIKGGPYIGPRGGKWADAAHKIPWSDDGFRVGRTLAISHQGSEPESFKVLGRTGDTLHLESARSGKFDFSARELTATLAKEKKWSEQTGRKKEETKRQYRAGRVFDAGHAKVEILTADIDGEELEIRLLDRNGDPVLDEGYAPTQTVEIRNFKKFEAVLDSFAPAGSGFQRTFSEVRLRSNTHRSIKFDLGWSYAQPEADEPSSKREFDVLASMELFTSRHVGTVRDPSSYQDSHTILPSGERDTLVTLSADAEVPITKTMYVTAGKVMRELAAAPYDSAGPAALHRGMRLSQAAADSLVEGATFDGGEIASWTGKRDTALKFSGGSAQGEGKKLPVAVIFTLADPKRGTYVDGVSAYSGEDEVISSGSMRVKSVRDEKLHDELTVRYVEVEHL